MKHIIITRLERGLYKFEPSYDETLYSATLTATELLEIAAWVEERKADLEAEASRDEKGEQK